MELKRKFTTTHRQLCKQKDHNIYKLHNQNNICIIYSNKHVEKHRKYHTRDGIIKRNNGRQNDYELHQKT